MAELTMKIGGKRGINWHVARHRNVGRAMQTRTFAKARRAEAILGAHRHDGHSRIEVDRGDIDWFISLSDERGDKAAMTIEFGREPGQFLSKSGELVTDRGMAPIAPIRKAVGLPL